LQVPFNTVQTANLSDWIETGASAGHHEWQGVLRVLGRMLDRPGLAEAAAIIEQDREEDKRDFLHRYPSDPCSVDFAREIELKEREAFEQSVRMAEQHIVRWVKETENMLKASRAQFESNLADLRAGRTFSRPEPDSVLQENPAHLREQIESYKTEVERERQRASAAEADSKLGNDRATAKRFDEYKSQLASLEADLQGKAATIAGTANEIVQLRATTRRTEQNLQEKNRQIRDLEDQRIILKRNSHLSRRFGFIGLTASIVGLVGGVGLGRVLVPESYSQSASVQNELAENQDKLNKSQADLAAKVAALDGRERQLATDQKSTTERDKAVKSAEDKIQFDRANLDGREKQLGVVQRDLAGREKTAKSAEDKIQSDRADLDGREKQLIAGQKVLTEREKAVKSAENNIQVDRANLDAREKQLVANQKALAELKTDVAEHDTAAARRDQPKHAELSKPVDSPPLPSSPALPTTADAPGLASICSLAPLSPVANPPVGGPYKSVAISPIMTGAKALRTVVISPDGRKIATAGDDHIIRLWDAASLKPIGRPLVGHTEAVYSLDFWHDGSVLASASRDGTVRIWNLATGQTDKEFKARDADGKLVGQFSVSFYPRQPLKYVNSAGDGGLVWIWDIPYEQKRNKDGHKGPNDHTIRSLRFAPNDSGEFVTAGFDGAIKFHLENGKVDSIAAFGGKALGVAFSPDGRRLASVGVDDNQNVKIWNASDRRLVKSWQGDLRRVVSVAWSPDGKRLATGGSDGLVKLWNAETGQNLRIFKGHKPDVEAVAINTQAAIRLASVGEDGAMKLWDIDSGKELLTVIPFDDGEYLAYAANGCYTGSAGVDKHFRVLVDGVEAAKTQEIKSAFFVTDGFSSLMNGK
jgi:WD40 repeat protein